MDDFERDQFVDEFGKAFGFVLCAALREQRSFESAAGAKQFATDLRDLVEQERFSPAVGVAILAVTDGMLAKLSAKPPTDWLAPGEII